ncbi:MAG: hypothetical protein DHS20C18_02910 [Saprospiraceae bacterium]|nr:MAG: hypothetical protein DHS20C18_02910 [Saprospiraceae bacterium]
MFKNIKSLFIIEEEDQSKPTPNKKGEPHTKSAQKIPDPGLSSKTKPAPTKASPGQVKGKFTEILFKAMEQHNLDGFDYLEYKQSLKSLEKMAMDEKTRYQSAFAMAQTMGASPEKLIQTAQHYLDVLKKEENKFGKALVSQKEKQIGSKEDQIAQLAQIIQEKNEQIRKLTLEIEQHQKQATHLKEQIGAASVKVESTKNDFIASYQALVNQIVKDMDNMKNYLK